MTTVDERLERLFGQQNGVATSGQILTHLSRYEFDVALKTGPLERIWQGIYCLGEATDELRLLGLDLSSGSRVPVCLASAAALFGFDTEQPTDLHVLNPRVINCVPSTVWWYTAATARHW